MRDFDGAVGTWDTADGQRAVSPQQLAAETAELLEAAEGKELWDQSVWFGRASCGAWNAAKIETARATAGERPDPWSCETRACFAGWTLLAGLRHGYTPGESQTWAEVVAQLLDVPRENADMMTRSDADKDDIRHFLELVAGEA